MMVAEVYCPNLLAAVKDNPAAMAELTALLQLVADLQARVVALEAQVAQLTANSRTSSKPPSSDRHNPNKPRPKSLRRSKGRRPGGQQGHPGHSLEWTPDPDEVVVHDVPVNCPECGASLAQAQPLESQAERRQVVELEKPSGKVIEHRAKALYCPHCGAWVRAPFPAGVNAPIQYGSSVQAAVVYLSVAQLAPNHRTAEIMGELCACPMSPGSVSSMVRRAGQGALQIIPEIRERLLEEPWLGFDETGLSLGGGIYWLHTASSPRWTLLHVHEKRGAQGVIAGGILARYTGKALHDFLSVYLGFEQCSHGLCNAHHLRDLCFVHEVLGQSWAQLMMEFLVEAKDEREACTLAERALSKTKMDRLQERYFEIIEKGYEQNPEPPPKPAGRRGRQSRGKALNLLDRFTNHHEKVMAFLIDPGIPFDNNQAERDLRMMKIHQKISGCFRSKESLEAFTAVRSILSTAAKHAVRALHAIKVLLTPSPSLGNVLSDALQGT